MEYEVFITENPTCAKFANNVDARAIFEIIKRKDNVLKMMSFSEHDKPALAACVKEIETYVDEQLLPSIDLNDDFTKKAIGRMVKTVLTPYGYIVGRQRDIPQKCQSKYFSTASCYLYSPPEDKCRIIIRDDIMEVVKNQISYANFHLEFRIEFIKSKDTWWTEKVIINHSCYELNMHYCFRTQGNTHLIFQSEAGLWFAISFDGHKGDMFVNQNPIIDYVVRILNMENLENGTTDEHILQIIKTYIDN